MPQHLGPSKLVRGSGTVLLLIGLIRASASPAAAPKVVQVEAVAGRARVASVTPRPGAESVYNLEVDTWRGKENLRLNILDFQMSGQPSVTTT